LTVAAVGLCAAGLFADDRQPATGEHQFTDKMFVEKAAIGGMFEVKSSQLAQQMGTDTSVKRFAARMITDHTKANQELMVLAQKKGWQVPTALDQKHLEMIDQLRKGGTGTGPSSDQFDRTYLAMQLKAHEKAVALFQQASRDSQDADLKAWATKTLPTLKDHLQMLRQISPAGGTNTPRTTTTTPPL
jgi:putative membrane protein